MSTKYSINLLQKLSEAQKVFHARHSTTVQCTELKLRDHEL